MQGIQINKQTVRSQLELEKKIELLRYAKIVCTTLASLYDHLKLLYKNV